VKGKRHRLAKRRKDVGLSQERLDAGEPASYRLSNEVEAKRLLRPYVWRRVQHALAALASATALYLRDGGPP
jgi:hypothetical protein